MIQGDPQYAFILAGANDEIEITKGAKRREVSGSESEDSQATLLRNMLFAIGLMRTEEV